MHSDITCGVIKEFYKVYKLLGVIWWRGLHILVSDAGVKGSKKSGVHYVQLLVFCCEYIVTVGLHRA